MQLLNLLLFWLFFGLLSSHLAKKRGKNPLLWFFMGLTLGIFGVILVYILPQMEPSKEKETVPLPLPVEESEAYRKMWYYLDPESKAQKGPLEFADLAKYFRQNIVTERTYIWGEGMAEWKRASDVPDLIKEKEKI